MTLGRLATRDCGDREFPSTFSFLLWNFYCHFVWGELCRRCYAITWYDVVMSAACSAFEKQSQNLGLVDEFFPCCYLLFHD